MIWRPLKASEWPDAIKHVPCGGSVFGVGHPGWGRCDRCGTTWLTRQINSWPQVELDARFLAGERLSFHSERRIWVETGNSLHGLYTTETDPDDREGTLSDGRRWWCYDHPYVKGY